MKIKKMYQGTVPENKIMNTKSNSKTDVYSCHYVDKLHTYSTEERVIGTWYDGRTLYEKTIITNEAVIAGTNLAIPHGVSGWEEMWLDVGNSYYYEAARRRSLPLIQTFYTTTNSTDRAHFYIERDYIYLVSTGGWSTGWRKVITIRYTKTAD